MEGITRMKDFNSVEEAEDYLREYFREQWLMYIKIEVATYGIFSGQFRDDALSHPAPSI